MTAMTSEVRARPPRARHVPLAVPGRLLRLEPRRTVSGTSTYGLISPVTPQGSFRPDSGVFYHYLPDLSIDQVLLLAGLAVAALGALGVPAPGSPVYAAATRFAALPAAARHAWLLAHLAALRAGQITLEQLP
jgi:hypothetical protein